MEFKIQILVEDKWETFDWKELNETILFGNDLTCHCKRFWTGLKDKNGNDIYEGDRVKRRMHLVEGQDYIDYFFHVKFGRHCYCLFIADKQMRPLDPIEARECEVVGISEEFNRITVPMAKNKKH